MELANVSLNSFFWPRLSCEIYTHIFSNITGIIENITSAPVVQQVVPNIGENNKVNFTVTTFSVVEVGTLSLFQLTDYLMSCFFLVSSSWQVKWFSDFEGLQLRLWRDTALRPHALPSILPTTWKGIVTLISVLILMSWLSFSCNFHAMIVCYASR